MHHWLKSSKIWMQASCLQQYFYTVLFLLFIILIINLITSSTSAFKPHWTQISHHHSSYNPTHLHFQTSCLVRTSVREHLDDADWKNTTSSGTVPVKRTVTHEGTVLSTIPPAEWKGSLCAIKHPRESLFPPGFTAVVGNLNAKWHLLIQAHWKRHSIVAIQMSVALYFIRQTGS